MALVMTPIYTQTVGAGGSSGILFNNIPQVYTDLKIVGSVREVNASPYSGTLFRFNNDSTALYSTTLLEGYAATASSRTSGASNSFPIPHVSGAQATANTFGNFELYLPNYTSSSHKQAVIDAVSENNSSATFGFQLGLSALLYRSTSPITSIQYFPAFSFAQHSTVSLYGIIRSGA